MVLAGMCWLKQTYLALGSSGKGCKQCTHMETVEDVEDIWGRKMKLEGVIDCNSALR